MLSCKSLAGDPIKGITVLMGIVVTYCKETLSSWLCRGIRHINRCWKDAQAPSISKPTPSHYRRLLSPHHLQQIADIREREFPLAAEASRLCPVKRCSAFAELEAIENIASLFQCLNLPGMCWQPARLVTKSVKTPVSAGAQGLPGLTWRVSRTLVPALLLRSPRRGFEQRPRSLHAPTTSIPHSWARQQHLCISSQMG